MAEDMPRTTHDACRRKKARRMRDGPTGNIGGREAAGNFFLAYLCSSAELEMACPPFEMSWPAPETVLQPASAAVPAISSKAMSRDMSVPLELECATGIASRIGLDQLGAQRAKRWLRPTRNGFAYLTKTLRSTTPVVTILKKHPGRECRRRCDFRVGRVRKSCRHRPTRPETMRERPHRSRRRRARAASSREWRCRAARAARSRCARRARSRAGACRGGRAYACA